MHRTLRARRLTLISTLALLLTPACKPVVASHTPHEIQVLRENVARVALAEEGRGPGEVGKDLNQPPYALGKYLGIEEAWCSEFACWTYKVAGVPLSTNESRWLLRNSTRLKRWFKSNRTFLSPEDAYWDTHTPQPGDYIRYNNRSGGHSGLVVGSEGQTLYTVEGNIKNRVARNRIRDWRLWTDIDGIGILFPQP